MERDKLKGSTRRFLSSQGSERDQIFREEIFPFIEEMINGVFLSLKISYLSQDEIKEIKQEIYLKILTRIKTQGLTGVRSFKNYYFITIKNITIDYLRSHNRDKRFIEILKNLILSRKYGKFRQTNKPPQDEGNL